MKKFYFQKVSFVSHALDFYNTTRLQKSLVLYSGNERGRYSFVLMDPSAYSVSPIALSDLDSFFENAQQDKNIHSIQSWHIPFAGGLGAIIPYEDSSDMVMGIYDYFLVEDTHTQECFLAGWFFSEEEANLWISSFEQFLYSSPSFVPVSVASPFVPLWTEYEYAEHFSHCQQELLNGNSFQINLSQKLQAITDETAWDIFCRATQKNPASMMAFWEDGENACISCSPERLFSSSASGELLTQPIAGTRKRGKTEEEDEKLAEELRTSIKEKAEHSMLVDLLRNDFGKVSEYGTVQVTDFARVEKYATVMHLVSDVVGKLSPQFSVFDALRATFPGGTVTGAPKKETMEILDREEKEPREMYCGSVFYASYSGHADSSILIRTLQKKGNILIGRAGGGVVVGADPIREYKETLHKFAGLQKIFDE